MVVAMKRRSFLIGLSAVIAAPAVMAMRSPEEPKLGEKAYKAGDTLTIDYSESDDLPGMYEGMIPYDQHLEDLKRDLGFTGEVVPWPVMSPSPD
jgi:hypothetical protein